MLTISEKAADKIRHLIESEGNSTETHGLRIKVDSGGCSGFQYQMDFVELPSEEGDLKVYDNEGSRVIIDSKSLLFVGGSVVDYLDGLTGAGFTIRNPNATGTCGCGQSFSV